MNSLPLSYCTCTFYTGYLVIEYILTELIDFINNCYITVKQFGILSNVFRIFFFSESCPCMYSSIHAKSSKEIPSLELNFRTTCIHKTNSHDYTTISGICMQVIFVYYMF